VHARGERDTLGHARVTPTEAWGLRLQAPPRRVRQRPLAECLCGGTRALRRATGAPMGGEVLVGALGLLTECPLPRAYLLKVVTPSPAGLTALCRQPRA
jgi:hypothetical protein